MLTCLAFSKKSIQFSPEQGRDIKYYEERQFYWLERTLITTDCKQTTVSLLLSFELCSPCKQPHSWLAVWIVRKNSRRQVSMQIADIVPCSSARWLTPQWVFSPLAKFKNNFTVTTQREHQHNPSIPVKSSSILLSQGQEYGHKASFIAVLHQVFLHVIVVQSCTLQSPFVKSLN